MHLEEWIHPFNNFSSIQNLRIQNFNLIDLLTDSEEINQDYFIEIDRVRENTPSSDPDGNLHTSIMYNGDRNQLFLWGTLAS